MGFYSELYASLLLLWAPAKDTDLAIQCDPFTFQVHFFFFFFLVITELCYQ